MTQGVYTRTEWHKERLRVKRPGAGRPQLGIPLSEETKEKMRISALKRWGGGKEIIQTWNMETKRYDVEIKNKRDQ